MHSYHSLDISAICKHALIYCFCFMLDVNTLKHIMIYFLNERHPIYAKYITGFKHNDAKQVKVILFIIWGNAFTNWNSICKWYILICRKDETCILFVFCIMQVTEFISWSAIFDEADLGESQEDGSRAKESPPERNASCFFCCHCCHCCTINPYD